MKQSILSLNIISAIKKFMIDQLSEEDEWLDPQGTIMTLLDALFESSDKVLSQLVRSSAVTVLERRRLFQRELNFSKGADKITKELPLDLSSGDYVHNFYVGFLKNLKKF